MKLTQAADLSISHNLSGELILQAQTYDNVQRAYVQACAARDASKLQLEAAIAERSEALRSAFQGEKGITETRLSLLMQSDPEALELRRAHAALVTECALWEAAVQSWRMRASMLRDLVSLAVAGGGGVVPQDAPPVTRAHRTPISR